MKREKRKRSLRKILSVMLIAAFIFTAVSAPGVEAQAATRISTSFVGKKKVASLYKTGTKTFYADLTRDNKKDKIKVKVTVEDYAGKMEVYINGKKALSENVYSEGAWGIEFSYVRQSKSKEYLYIYAPGDQDYTAFCRVYRYNSSTGKLKCILSAENAAYQIDRVTLASVTKSRLSFRYEAQPLCTGLIKYQLNYVYKGGKLKKVSSTSNASSLLGGYYDIDSDYVEYFAKNQYVTQSDLTLYASPGSKTVSVTVGADETVTLKKVRIKNKNTYLKFTYGGKSGWICTNDVDETTFYGVVYLG